MYMKVPGLMGLPLLCSQSARAGMPEGNRVELYSIGPSSPLVFWFQPSAEKLQTTLVGCLRLVFAVSRSSGVSLSRSKAGVEVLTSNRF